ncbi:MAG TPA: NUDIX hydrolase [Thermoanaerobaculia bacterium]|nr:NUDIX hydrolase [Thermoanaerobaculia bacterium]
MAEVEPIPAASVLLLRDDPLEVLMIRRPEKSSFAPDVWAFPGGMVEEEDSVRGGGDPLNTMRFAASRELFEETGIQLVDLEKFVWTAHWITPVGMPKRFDTYFFLACTDRMTVAAPSDGEIADATWIAPAEAVERHMRGEFPLVFPTLKNLEAIVGFRTSGELIESRRKAEIGTTRPMIVVEDGRKKIVLP